ncbi:MAG: hypothetical protein WB443_05640 [Nitrososphaeraceae archaeon]
MINVPRVQQNGIVSRLHYALTDSQCNVCGAQLQWKAKFNDINSPKYTAKHCNLDYIITVDTVKVEVVDKKSVEQGEGKAEESSPKSGGENERQQQQQQQKRQEQQKALTMAELLKDKESLKKKTKLGDGSNIKAEDR